MASAGSKGNKKRSSPSRAASHQRARANAETRRKARIARHRARMGLNITQTAAATSHTCPVRKTAPRIDSFTVFSSPVPGDIRKYPGPVYILLSNGATLDIGPDYARVRDSAPRHTATPFTLEKINPTSGVRTLLEKRG